ncbi:MAG: hypothetical protein LIQ31_11165, partial [Planctomycetes bacterium]|nr:hypothetical protein [Planctomycetota bacterium]
SDQLANSAESSRNGGTGGRAAAAAERLRTATESLAALREMGAAVAAASGTAGDGEGEAAAAGDGNTLGQSGTGHGGISRGRGDAPLVLADGTERGDRTLDYIPLTATGRSRFDGPELNRTRIGLGDDHEPEARRAATQSTVDAPLRLGAGATVVAPGPTRGRWVDAYFDAVTSQPNTLQSGEGKNR